MLLEISNLTKSFGGVQALHAVSFSINDGEIVGLIGPNGSGKTTLVNTITGVHAPDAGRVRLANRTVTAISPAQAARMGIARTFQSPRPFLRMTVLENVAVAAFLHTRDVAEALREAQKVLVLVGLEPVAAALAAVLPSERRKRLDLARAIAVRPRVLFLDEVMAGLNPVEQSEGIALIQRVNAMGVAIVYIEHVMKTVITLCPRVIVLDHGEQIAEGTPTTVLADPRVVEAYLGKPDAQG